ncbi:MAG: aromatic amino acid DMT transporter YddG [Desulfovibrio sp.]|nr:aromatic amino acid DMT transporter YddG [Desulfovibrio sp.]
MCIPSQRKATLTGLMAPISWGMSVGLSRCITEQFGLAAGLTILNIAICIFLLLFFGRPRLGEFPKKYLLLGIPMANISSLCFYSSIYLSDGGAQTMEVGMVNYLWPCLVLLIAVLFNGQRARWWLLPGITLSFAGILLVLGGEQGFDLSAVCSHFRHNPWSYILAFFGALSWAIYSNLTRAWSNGKNPTLIIFIIDAILFSCLWATSCDGISQASLMGWISLFLGAIAMGGSYAAWSYGVTKGNITVLAIASYFTPVLSCLFATLWIGARLDQSFWIGVFVIVTGSLVCWSSSTVIKKRIA